MRKISSKQKEKNKEKTEQTLKQFALFREIWDEREDETGFCYCFETNQRLDPVLYRSNSAVYDHVLEKQTYPEYRFNKKNIVILHPEVHQQKGNNIDKCPKLKAYREKLLSLHLEHKLEKDGNI